MTLKKILIILILCGLFAWITTVLFPAKADTVTLSVTGTVAPYQFNNGYVSSQVLDNSGFFGGGFLAGDAFSVLWTFTDDFFVSAELVIVGHPVDYASSLYSTLQVTPTQAYANITQSLGSTGPGALNTYIKSTDFVFPFSDIQAFSYDFNPLTDNLSNGYPPSGIGGSFRVASLTGYLFVDHMELENLTNPDAIASPPSPFRVTAVLPGPTLGAGLPGLLLLIAFGLTQAPRFPARMSHTMRCCRRPSR